jgi:protein SCO1/2
MYKSLFFVAVISLLFSCGQSDLLPIYGEREVATRIENGKTITDTIYQTIPPFALVNQDSQLITNQTVQGKVYVADFFFTSCPTICPVMKKELLAFYQAFKGNLEVLILSHTIDPEYDTVELLRNYANDLGADSKQWHFLTGDKDVIYELAANGYYATAMPDSTEPGGYVHSGGFILVDRKQRVRGVYDGTSSDDIKRLIKDTNRLLKEESE